GGGGGGGEGLVDGVWAEPRVKRRLWAAQAGRIYVSDDLGSAWRPLGRALPEAATIVRGIAADNEASTLLVATNGGLYRSDNGGAGWAPQEEKLPIPL